MSKDNPKTITENLTETAAKIATGVENTVASVLTSAKEAVSKVAPAVWGAIKKKVIADATALIIFTATIGASIWLIAPENKWIMVGLIPVCGIIVGSAVKRIIASDYFALMEILTLAKWRKGGE